MPDPSAEADGTDPGTIVSIVKKSRLTRLIPAALILLSATAAVSAGIRRREAPNQLQPTRTARPDNLPLQRSKSLPAKFTNQYRMEFVLIPEGKFTMGSAAGADMEKPAHSVTIGQPFYIGRYEVTQWQWRAVMGTTVDDQRRKIRDGSILVARPMAGEGDDRPAYYVSWQEAHVFLQRLNALNDGHTYRLPAEAEWEYVCRAGATEDRPAELNLVAQYKNNANNYVQPVGMRRPNAFQIYDLIGNVWEWCEDVFHLSYEGAPADASSWLTNDELSQRVKRGGSFFTKNFDYLRCAARAGQSVEERDVETGFRVVATVK
ncbi:MAG TPA: formylglycine-generating enzyme family protein [Pyrinomonadaceae bacterium]|nr:formylglycine-generating enzyme family protein [Pyrinomonadaceae bacterium]